MQNASWPGPIEVWAYYLRSQDALEQLAIAVRSNGFRGRASTFDTLTPDQLDDLFADLRDELDAHVTLMLVASFEAVLRVDLLNRLGGPRDALNKRMRQLWKQKGPRVSLNELLVFWKSEIGGAHSRRFSNFGRLFSFRHWLAHGRYWNQKSGLVPDPAEAWAIARELFAVLPGFPRLP